MPYEGRLSAAVYNSSGQLIRSLHDGERRYPGTVTLTWDGKDDLGNPSPAGTYRYRALTTQATIVEDGSVGDNGEPAFSGTDRSGNVQAVALDASNALYEAAATRDGFFRGEVRKWLATGQNAWRRDLSHPRAIATDGAQVYVAHTLTYIAGENRIVRFSATNGTPQPFTGVPNGHIVANATHNGVYGLAVAGQYLWASNYAQNRVQLFHKDSGVLLAESLNHRPRGIAADATGRAWFFDEINTRVRELVWNGATLALTGREIVNASGVDGVALGGPNNHLFVTEKTTGIVRTYDVSATTPTVTAARFGAHQAPGVPPESPSDPSRDSRFYWPWLYDQSLAPTPIAISVSSSGRLAVNDLGIYGGKVLVFDPGSDIPVMKHISMGLQAPRVDTTVGADVVMSGSVEYRVDHTTGNWDLVGNWAPQDGNLFTPHSWRRRLQNREYLFYAISGAPAINSYRGIAIYDITDNTMRRTGIVGREASANRFIVWRDTNGDGVEGPGDFRSSQTSVPVPGTYVVTDPGVWVDDQGNLWIANYGQGSSTRLPFQGLDANQNPIYDWSSLSEAIPPDQTAFAFAPKQIAVAPGNGTIFRLGNTAYDTSPAYHPTAFHAVDVSNASGSRRSVFRLPFRRSIEAEESLGFGALAADPSGDYFYVAGAGRSPFWSFAGHYQSFLHMYTTDGLRVATGLTRRGGALGSGAGLAAFTDPATGTRYVYIADPYHGRMVRDRVDDLASTRTFSGTISWGGVPAVKLTNLVNREPILAGSTRSVTVDAVPLPGTTIARVELFQGETPIGVDETAPYAFEWSVPATPGREYSLTAVAHGSNGTSGRDTAITLISPVAGVLDWLRAESVVARGQGQPIAEWPSARNFIAVQPVPAHQPTLQLSSMNGRPAVRFDGVDDLVRYDSGRPQTNYTVAAVFRTTNGDDRGAFFQAERPYSTGGDRELGVLDGYLYHRPNLRPQSPTRVNDNAPHWTVATVGPSGTSLYLDGALASTAATTVSLYPNSHLVFGGIRQFANYGQFEGELSEFFYIDHVLSETERQALDAYLRGSYMVTLTSPVAGSVYGAPAEISLGASVAPAAGPIDRVEFFDGENRIHVDTSAPYGVLWTGVGRGNYSFTARAYNGSTLVATSLAVPVRVSVRQCNADSDCSLGQICWLGQGGRFDMPQATGVCVDPACVTVPTPSCGSRDMPCGICPGQPSGGCEDDAQCNAGDVCGWNNGEQFGAPMERRVCWPAQCDDPEYFAANCGTSSSPCGLCGRYAVRLTSPSRQSVHAAPATLEVAAAVAVATGPVTRVDFYEGTHLLGSDATAPFSFTWSDIPVGRYSLSARVYNGNSLVASSVPVAVRVLNSECVANPECRRTNPIVDAPVILKPTWTAGSGASGTTEITTPAPVRFEIPRDIWVGAGNAGNGRLELSFRDTNGATTVCTYRGGSAVTSPTTDLEYAKGLRYTFPTCTNGFEYGEAATATWFQLSVVSAAANADSTSIDLHLGGGCSGTLPAALSPEEVVATRETFNWRTVAALPESDSEGFPALWHGLIYVQRPEQLQALDRWRVYWSTIPLSRSYMEDMHSKCGRVEHATDRKGVIVYAVFPARLFNVIRTFSIEAVLNNVDPPFQVWIPSTPDDPEYTNPDGSLRYSALASSGYTEWLAARPPQAPFIGGVVNWVSNAVSDAGNWIDNNIIDPATDVVEDGFSYVASGYDSAVDWTANAIDDVWEEVQVGLGNFVGIFDDHVNVTIDLQIMNRDRLFWRQYPAFSPVQTRMVRGWGIQQDWSQTPQLNDGTRPFLAPHGVPVRIRQWGWGFLPVLNQSKLPDCDSSYRGPPFPLPEPCEVGRVTVQALRGADGRGGSGLCVELASDDVMMTSDLVPNEVCDFGELSFDFERSATQPVIVTTDQKDLHALTQIIDGADYMRKSMGIDPHRFDVLIGPLAAIAGDRARCPCLDFPQVGPAVGLAGVAAIASLINPSVSAAALAVAVPASPLLMKDLWLPDVPHITDSRGVVTHEYGHFAMCSLLYGRGGGPSALTAFIPMVFSDGKQEINVVAESFADIFALQVTGGTNYVRSDGATQQGAMGYCRQPLPATASAPATPRYCMEFNYQGEGDYRTDEFEDKLAEIESTIHDAFDRADSDHRFTSHPWNGDVWMATNDGVELLSFSHASYLTVADEPASMRGVDWVTWVESWAARGSTPDINTYMSALADAMEGANNDWCARCEVFAIHEGFATDATGAPSRVPADYVPVSPTGAATRWARWRTCATNERVRGWVGAPPEAFVNIDANCSPCPPFQIPTNGVCTPCPSGQVARGDHCEACPPNYGPTQGTNECFFIPR